jgi:hypothetical protein
VEESDLARPSEWGVFIMAGVITDQAKVNTLNFLIMNLLGVDFVVHLGVAGLHDDTFTTLADCTPFEATFLGYSPLQATGWSVPVLTPGVDAVSSATVVYTPTGAGGTGPITGYYITDAAVTLLYGVEVFSTGPVNIPLGEKYNLTIQYQIYSEF